MSEEIKKIVENAASEEEFMKRLDKTGHCLSDEEMEAVSGGNTLADQCGAAELGNCGSFEMINM